MNNLQLAVSRIDEALLLLKLARTNLSNVRNGQATRLFVEITHIEEVREILTDPECTPEFHMKGENDQ